MWKPIFHLENRLLHRVSDDQHEKNKTKQNGESGTHKGTPQDNKDDQKLTFNYQVGAAQGKHSNSHLRQERGMRQNMPRGKQNGSTQARAYLLLQGAPATHSKASQSLPRPETRDCESEELAQLPGCLHKETEAGEPAATSPWPCGRGGQRPWQQKQRTWGRARSQAPFPTRRLQTDSLGCHRGATPLSRLFFFFLGMILAYGVLKK